MCRILTFALILFFSNKFSGSDVKNKNKNEEDEDAEEAHLYFHDILVVVSKINAQIFIQLQAIFQSNRHWHAINRIEFIRKLKAFHPATIYVSQSQWGIMSHSFFKGHLYSNLLIILIDRIANIQKRLQMHSKIN